MYGQEHEHLETGRGSRAVQALTGLPCLTQPWFAVGETTVITPTPLAVPGARARSLRPIPPSFPSNLLLPVMPVHVVILKRERHRNDSNEPFLLDNDLKLTDLPLNTV